MSTITNLTEQTVRPRPTSRRKHSFDAYDAISEGAANLQRYQDIPLRLQKQWITMFLAIMILLGLVAGLYLNVTSRAAIAGREIQNLEAEIIANERVNADLQTEIASLLSYSLLEQRAKDAGFATLESVDLDYLVVPGYYPKDGVNMVMPVNQTDILAMSPEFSESLLSWVARQLESASLPLAKAR